MFIGAKRCWIDKIQCLQDLLALVQMCQVRYPYIDGRPFVTCPVHRAMVADAKVPVEETSRIAGASAGTGYNSRVHPRPHESCGRYTVMLSRLRSQLLQLSNQAADRASRRQMTPMVFSAAQLTYQAQCSLPPPKTAYRL